MRDRAVEAVRHVLGGEELDEPIVEWLASLAIDAASASDADALAGLAEALAGCAPAWGDGEVLAAARAVLRRIGELRLPVPPAAVLAAPKAPVRLSATASAFMPAGQAAVPSASVSGEVVAATASGDAHVSCAAWQAEATWAGGSEWEWQQQQHDAAPWGHQHASPVHQHDHDQQGDALSVLPDLPPDDAAELLSMWFSDYSTAALQELLCACGGHLDVCVQELLLMEGEEPFEARDGGGGGGGGGSAALHGANGAAGLSGRAPPPPSADDFPALGLGPAGTSPPAGAGGAGAPWGGSKARSARDALLAPRQGSAVAAPAWGSSSSSHSHAGDDGSGGSGVPFWAGAAEGGGGAAEGGGGGARSGPRMAGGAPVVATGAALREMYGAAREEARAHALARHEAFRRATSAYVSGHRDLAQRLSSEARGHGQAMAEADARAAATIFRERNSGWGGGGGGGGGGKAFLDLHGLHVKEACLLLSSVLRQRNGGRLMVCAGAGKHSERTTKRAAAAAAATGAEPRGRLEAAIERLIARSGHGYRELHAGLFEIF
ncbi:hypothetical protein FOA52_011724 [Chlamydomonas sp. UWO 241]|nr:hypothetical protein FOA52_011724 [Chlamydomonas sp. UWO 241]